MWVPGQKSQKKRMHLKLLWIINFFQSLEWTVNTIHSCTQGVHLLNIFSWYNMLRFNKDDFFQWPRLNLLGYFLRIDKWQCLLFLAIFDKQHHHNQQRLHYGCSSNLKVHFIKDATASQWVLSDKWVIDSFKCGDEDSKISILIFLYGLWSRKND